MTILAVFNQKGGVGKTTTALNLGAAMMRRGHLPLGIDLDPQAHLSAISGAAVVSSDDSIYSFYTRSRPLQELIRPVSTVGRIVPAHLELSKADTVLGKGFNVVNRLNNGLQRELSVHDNSSVIIDCCPMLGVLSLSAIFASDRLIVPISTDFLAVKGAIQVEKTLKALEQVLKRRLERRYVLTRFDSRRKMAWDIVTQLEQKFGEELCKTRISENVSIAESPAFERDVFAHAPQSRGAADYEALLNELLLSGFLQESVTLQSAK